MIYYRFKSVTIEYYPIILGAVIIYAMTLYVVEKNLRKLYLMYQNVLDLKSKMATILH